MSQKTLANQASKALSAVKSKFSQLHLSVLFKIFDSNAETRMSREKSEERDLIKSDCFLIEIVD